MEKIELFKANGGWMARSQEHVALFGTDVLPTAYLDTAPDQTVLNAIRKLNPNAVVTIA